MNLKLSLPTCNNNKVSILSDVNIELTQSGGSEIQYRSIVAAGIQDMILILKHLTADFRHHTVHIIIINKNRLW